MKHMRSATPVVKQRSSVELKSLIPIRNLFMKNSINLEGYAMISLCLFHRAVVDANAVDIELTETDIEGKKMRLENVALTSGDGTFVILKDGKLTVSEKGE
jgi:hypothetical protein